MGTFTNWFKKSDDKSVREIERQIVAEKFVKANAELSRAVNSANQLAETITDLLNANDRVTHRRLRHARKSLKPR